MNFALALLAVAAAPAQHGFGAHGNPDDLAGYIAKMQAPDRAAWQKPDQVVAALGLMPGQTACDLGAGPGYFTLRLAKAVGESGRVFAVDVEPRMLSALAENLAKAKLRSVTPVLALPDDSLLPNGACDLILVVDTYHHLTGHAAYLKALIPKLAKGGRIANIDFKRSSPIGPSPEHRVSREQFLADAKQAGLGVVGEKDFLPYQYFVFLARK